MAKSSLPKELKDKLKAQNGGKLKTMSQMEKSIEALKEQLAKQAMDELLGDLGPEDATPKDCPKCGKKTPVRTQNVERTFFALSGQHTIFRNYHYCEHCTHGFYPRDAQIGLPTEGEVTLELEKRMFDFAINDPYGECSRRWSMHYTQEFSATLFNKVAERVGKRLEQAHDTILQQELLTPEIKKTERLYVLNDGSMLPMVGGKWKEAKLGVIFRKESHSPYSKKKRGSITQARYVAVWGDQEEFKEHMRHALDVEGWQHAKEIVWLGDGALGNWTLSESLAPLAVQILDVQHAIQHGVNFGKALLGETNDALPLWHKRIEQLVYASDVDALIGELMDSVLEAEDNPFILRGLDSLITYYRHNQHRMNYKHCLAQGMMIGSGVVESGHRHVFQSRMKRSGQHWAEPQGRRMARMRAAYKTAGVERVHHAINRALCLTERYAQRLAKKAA
jgi:hypothetical protein